MKKTVYGASHIEKGALDQFESAMAQSYVVQGALMADAHLGYSLPIGGVVATKGVIVPSWVGYDIGCGMSAVMTPFYVDHVADEDCRRRIFEAVYRSVPTGTGGRHETKADWACGLPRTEFADGLYDSLGRLQLGTLGSGNHFIEVGHDEKGRIWVVIHSGSRGFGYKTAQHYMKAAAGGKAREGHYPLDANSRDGRDYIDDMNFALAFALENRERMILATLKDINWAIHGKAGTPDVDRDTFINRTHNHAVLREIGGQTTWIHRKGATHAEKDMMGVIPGSMLTGSFVVRGLGNPDSLFSSSHGAGRALSRREAKRTLSLEDFQRQMEGITALVSPATIDESPMAYKDIFTVMEEQRSLIDVVHHLKPIINVKAAGGHRRRGR
ncbi:MAG: RtcB family protein [Rhodospirillales bacterium]